MLVPIKVRLSEHTCELMVTCFCKEENLSQHLIPPLSLVTSLLGTVMFSFVLSAAHVEKIGCLPGISLPLCKGDAEEQPSWIPHTNTKLHSSVHLNASVSKPPALIYLMFIPYCIIRALQNWHENSLLSAVSTQHPVHTSSAVTAFLWALFGFCCSQVPLWRFQRAGFKEQSVNGASGIEIFCECCSLGFTFILPSEYLCLGKAAILEVLLWGHSSVWKG